MLVFAAVHLHPVWSITPAAAIVFWIIWYWIRLGSERVPLSRKRIRRLSLAIMTLSLPMFVRALSFVDSTTQQRAYVMAWSVAFSMVLLIMLVSAIDVANTLRLMNQHAHEEMRRAALELGQTIKTTQHSAIAQSKPRHTRNGEAKSS